MTQTWHRCSPSTDFYEKSKNPRHSNGHLYLFPFFAHTLCHLVCVLSAHTLNQHNNTLLLLLSSFRCTRPKTYTITDCMMEFGEKTHSTWQIRSDMQRPRNSGDSGILVRGRIDTGRTETWGVAGEQNSWNEGSDSENQVRRLGRQVRQKTELERSCEIRMRTDNTLFHGTRKLPKVTDSNTTTPISARIVM